MSEHLTLKPKNLRNELINPKNGRTFPTIFPLKNVTPEFLKMQILKFMIK